MATERTFRRRLRSGWILAILGTTSAHALPHFEIPSGCGTVDEYQAGMRARLGAEASELLEALTVKISPKDSGYRLEVRLGTSTRHIEDQDCRALVRAATVVAIALWESPKRTPHAGMDPLGGPSSGSESPPHDPESTAFESGSSNGPSRGALPPPLPAYVPEATPGATRNPNLANSWSVALEAHAGPVAGLVPGVSGLFELKPSLRFGSLEVGVSASYVMPREQVDTESYGVRVSAFGIAPTLTWSPHPRVGMQGGAAVFLLTGTGRGSERDQTDHAWAFGPQVGIRAKVLQYRRAWIALGGMAQLELVRPRFEIRAYGEVFRPFWANGSVHLGVGFAFD